ncbi:hypothetical protein [Algibacter sp. L4_22]|uniref:hypothetical protein n=1 Tax=Algibacter sp. L4_22 TaxID=2942477 RepID=UPI00201B6D2E|nr:hypothetical protein [Algibacter sp. L4_22]MCL5127117.1 hypothetical protein [Algibacter sp. L4_22]
MKFKIGIILFFASFFVNSQTSLQFVNAKQEFDFSKDSISLEVKMNKVENYVSTYPIIFEISSDLKDDKIIGITETKTIQKVVLPNQLIQKLIIKVPISQKNIAKVNSFTFKIKKTGLNDAFTILNDTHVVVLIKKEEIESNLSLSHNGSDIVNVDFSKDQEIILPFKIDAKGYIPLTEDSLKIKLRIKNLEAFKDTISFKSISKTAEHNFEIKKIEDSKVFSRVLKEIDSLDKIELQIIEVEGKSKKVFKHSNNTLKYFLKTSNKQEVRYNFYIGTNFDLKDKFEANSFYSEFDVFAPNLIWKRAGLRFGAYKNNSTNSLEEDSRSDMLFEITNTSSDSISYSTKRANKTPSVSKENLGIYFELLYNIIESENKNFKLFAAAHIEATQRSDTYSFDNFDLITLKNTTISLDSLSNNTELQLGLTTPKTFTRKYIDSYFGLSLPMQYYNPTSDLEFFLNPIIGFGNPGLNISSEKHTKLSYFGAFQAYFVVASKKGLGIRLGGEIRHYFNYITNPIFNLNLSTKINLEDIIGSSKTNE